MRANRAPSYSRPSQARHTLMNVSSLFWALHHVRKRALVHATHAASTHRERVCERVDPVADARVC